jgi:hypothetical protein
METSMPEDARTMPEAQPDAQGHDDAQPSIDTVIDGLAFRSDAERGALLKALLDGDALKPDTPPVSGTTTQKSLENQSFRPRSRPDCSPRVSPKTFLDHGLSHSDCTGSGEAN